MIFDKKAKLIKTKWGFYKYDAKLTEEELMDYYANKYFQQGHGSYSVSYTDEEIDYFRLKSQLIYLKISGLMNLEEKKKLVDIGCGEGWLINEFFSHGHTVKGLDYSEHGLKKFNAHLLDFLEQGSIYDLIKTQIENETKFNILTLTNVLEHVLDPARLLQDIKKIMHNDSVLIITVPNDFSTLHQHLLSEKIIKKEFWLSYPDHISYFNKENMEHLLTDMGFKLISVVADNPIDLNLLNENSNYIEDENKGRNTHLFRVKADNFLASLDTNKLLNIYEILGSMGVGRDLTYYCSISR